jgi:hypothetical protein
MTKKKTIINNNLPLGDEEDDCDDGVFTIGGGIL